MCDSRIDKVMAELKGVRHDLGIIEASVGKLLPVEHECYRNLLRDEKALLLKLYQLQREQSGIRPIPEMRG